MFSKPSMFCPALQLVVSEEEQRGSLQTSKRFQTLRGFAMNLVCWPACSPWQRQAARGLDCRKIPPGVVGMLLPRLLILSHFFQFRK